MLKQMFRIIMKGNRWMMMLLSYSSRETLREYLSRQILLVIRREQMEKKWRIGRTGSEVE